MMPKKELDELLSREVFGCGDCTVGESGVSMTEEEWEALKAEIRRLEALAYDDD